MHLRTAVIQVNARDNPAENLATVERFLDRAAQMGAQFVSLPEFWTYLGPYSGFEKAGQSIPGTTSGCSSPSSAGRRFPTPAPGSWCCRPVERGFWPRTEKFGPTFGA